MKSSGRPGHTATRWSGLLGLITAGLTAFYMFRLMFLAFYGEERFSDETRHHLHESPRSMTVPLMVLAVLSIVGGFVGLPAWLNWDPIGFSSVPGAVACAGLPIGGGGTPHSIEMGFALISVLVALIGIFVAYRFYVAASWDCGGSGRPNAAGLYASAQQVLRGRGL